MKTLIGFLLVTMLPCSVSAQTSGVAAYFRAVYTQVNVESQKMAEMCYPITSFNKSYYGIGAEAYYRSGKNIFGWDGFVAAHGVRSEGVYYAEPFVVLSTLRIGYIVYETPGFFVYPGFGAGAGLLGITTYNQPDNIKSDINTMYLLTPSAEFGINADKAVYTFSNGRAVGAFLFGIRAGYRYSAGSQNWKKVADNNLPKVKMAPRGFYLGISLGISNFRPDKAAADK